MASTTQPASAKRARTHVKEEESAGGGHSGTSAVDELKKLVEGNAATLKRMEEAIKSVGDKPEASSREQLKRMEEIFKVVGDRMEALEASNKVTVASLKQTGEVLRAINDKSDASNRMQFKRMEEVLKAGSDKAEASNREHLERIKEALKSNDERMKKVESSVLGTSRNAKMVSAKPKLITQLGEIIFPFKIADLKKAPTWLESEKVDLMGAQWYITVREKSLESVDFLSVYLQCDPLKRGDIYKTNFTIQLIGSKDKIMRVTDCCFKKTKGENAFGWSDFTRWATLMDKANCGFVDEHGKAVVRAIFTFELQHDRGGSPFFDPSSFNSDCVLLVEKKRVHVNKGLLSVHSAYFDKLFNADVSEKNREEIKVEEDVEAFEFVQLLEAIYPSMRHEITAGNVECLLRMADRFQTEIVTQRCEAFLQWCPTASISIEKKLVLAQNYRLEKLLELCVAEYRTWEDMKKLKRSGEYALLSSETVHLIVNSI